MKNLLKIAFVLLIGIFGFFFTNNVYASDSTCTISPSQLKAGTLNQITFSNIDTHFGSGQSYYVSLDSGGSGACVSYGDNNPSNRIGCYSGNKTATDNDQSSKSITFTLDDLKRDTIKPLDSLTAGTYNFLTLCLDSGDICLPACRFRDITVNTTDDEPPPPPDPDKNKNKNEICQIKTDADKELCENEKYPPGNCASGLFCNNRHPSGGTLTCELNQNIGICSEIPPPDPNDPDNECEPEVRGCVGENCKSDDCFSGKCNTSEPPFKCAGGRTALACKEVKDSKGDGTGKFVCQTAVGNINTDPNSFGRSVLALLLAMAGGILLILIIVNGYRIMISQGDPEKIKEGRDGIIAAIAGMLLIIFSLSILRLITSDILGIPGFG